MSDELLPLGAAIARRHLAFVAQGPILARAANVSAFAARRGAFTAAVLQRWARRDADTGGGAWMVDLQGVRTPADRGEASPMASTTGPRAGREIDGRSGAVSRHPRGLDDVTLRAHAAAAPSRPEVTGGGVDVVPSGPAIGTDTPSHHHGVMRLVREWPTDRHERVVSYTSNEGGQEPSARAQASMDAPVVLRPKRMPGAVPVVHPVARVGIWQEFEAPAQPGGPAVPLSDVARAMGGPPPLQPAANRANAAAPTHSSVGSSAVHDSHLAEQERRSRPRPDTSDRSIKTGRGVAATQPVNRAVRRRRFEPVSAQAVPTTPSGSRTPSAAASPGPSPLRWPAPVVVARARSHESAPQGDVGVPHRPGHAPPAPDGRTPGVGVVPEASITRQAAPPASGPASGTRTGEDAPAPGAVDPPRRQTEMDIDEVVERVVHRLSRQVAIEAERRGVSSWRSRS